MGDQIMTMDANGLLLIAVFLPGIIFYSIIGLIFLITRLLVNLYYASQPEGDRFEYQGENCTVLNVSERIKHRCYGKRQISGYCYNECVRQECPSDNRSHLML